MDYRWLTNDEIADIINPSLERQGFAQLNVNPEQPTCRVLGAVWDGQIVEAFAFQFFPILGPMFKVDETFRDNGDASRTLATKMGEFFEEVQARAAMCVVESPVTARLCERFGMKKIENPVYSYVRGQ